MGEARGITYEHVVLWLVPALLSGILGVLGWMGHSISDMSKTLAVAVSKIEDHERRLQILELP